MVLLSCICTAMLLVGVSNIDIDIDIGNLHTTPLR